MREALSPEGIYALGPDTVTTEMIETMEKLLKPLLPDTGPFIPYDTLVPFAQAMLETAKEYYRLGAFNMEHRDGKRCEAEDQGGWPACSNPAEFFVKRQHLLAPHTKAPVYCSVHRDNRFYGPEHLAPIYENPSGKTEG